MKLSEWKKDDVFKELLKVRDSNVHNDQIQTETQARLLIAHTVSLTKEEWAVPMPMPDRPLMQNADDNPIIEWWRFDNEMGDNILQFCRSVIPKLESIIEEYENRFD